MNNALLALSSKKSKAYVMKTKPSVWEISRGSIPVQLYMLKIKLSDNWGTPHHPMILLTRTQMPIFPEFPLYLARGQKTIVNFSPFQDPLQLDSDAIEKLTIYTLRIFEDVFNKKYEQDSKNMSYWLTCCTVRVARARREDYDTERRW